MSHGYKEHPLVPFFRKVPRFGHSSDFVALFESPDHATDYVLGLLFVAALLFTLLFLWSYLLLLFKACGPKRVGFLSGEPFRIQQTHKPTTTTTTTTQPQRQPVNRGPALYRWTFLLCGCTMILSSVFFVIFGLTQTRDTQASVHYSAENIYDLSIELGNVVGNFSAMTPNRTATTNKFMALLQNPPDCFLSNNNHAASILTNATAALSKLGLKDPLATSEVHCFVDFTQHISQQLYTSSSDWIISDGLALLVLISYILVPAILMIAVACVGNGVFMVGWMEHLLHHTVLPLFSFMVFAAFSVASLLLLTATATADLCTSPDQTIVGIVETLANQYEGCPNYSDPSKSLLSNVVTYFVQHCRGDYPLAYLEGFVNDVNLAQHATVLLEHQLRGVSCAADLRTVSLELLKEFQYLREGILTLLGLLRCDDLLPLYQIPVDEGLCSSSLSGIAWMTASFFAVAVAGLTMITLRASWQEDLVVGDQRLGFEAEPIVTVAESEGNEDDESAMISYIIEEEEEEKKKQKKEKKNKKGKETKQNKKRSRRMLPRQISDLSDSEAGSTTFI